MKKIQLAFAIILMSALFLNASAQGKKWEIGTSYTATFLKLKQTSNAISKENRSNTGMATPNLFISRTISFRTTIGVGLGKSWLDYELDIDKNIHQLNGKLHLSDSPDYSKTTQILDDIEFKNSYLNIPIFAKIRLSKNREKPFQPSFGLRIDNHFLQKSSSLYDFDGGGGSGVGSLFAGLFLTALTGDSGWLYYDNSSTQWAPLTISQRREIANYYDAQNAKFMINISSSISFDWQFKNVSFGVEPFLTIAARKVNRLINSQNGSGVQTHFAIRF